MRVARGRRWGLAVWVCLAVVACSSEDGSDAAGPRGDGDRSPRTSATVEVPAVAGLEGDREVSLAVSRAVVEARLGELPVPDSVGGCLADQLSRDGELVAAWDSAEEGAVAPDGVLTLAARCMEMQEALPLFVEGVDSQVGGLSEGQRRCLEQGYLRLPVEVLDAVRAEAVGGAADDERVAELAGMVRGCGVKGLGR